MATFKIENGTSKNNEEKKKSLWRTGKENTKKFYEVKTKKSTEIKSFLAGILLTFIVICPILLILITLFKAFYYDPRIKLLLISIAWGLLLLCNGLSNMFTVKVTKKYFPQDPKLMSVDEMSILFYQTFNIGFIFFTLVILIFVAIGVL